MNDTVLMDQSEGVATVTLNRPQALNALSDDMIEALLEIMPRIEADPAVRCVVLRGARPGRPELHEYNQGIVLLHP